MPFIEGIGDEVVHFFGAIFIIFLGVVAWFSTRISEIPPIRTVIIVERRTQNVTTQQPNLLSHSDRLDSTEQDGDLCQQNTLTVNNEVDKSELPANAGSCLAENVSNSNSVNSTETSSKSNDASAPEERMETEEQNQSASSNTDNIRIRLKYLNDDQKLVEGRLQELLGDFKRRHFSMELSAQKLVRLIFNGQVLQRDDQTLQGCGLYDNCVVHCLVHAQQNANRANSQQRINSPSPDWNLGGFLYACLVLILGLAWACRFNYAHLFTLTTTLALIGLTGMFAVYVIGLYIPDQEQQTTTTN